MTELSFESRLAALGLQLSDAEQSGLAELVRDMDRAADVVRGLARSYFDEPSNVFRLTTVPWQDGAHND